MKLGLREIVFLTVMLGLLGSTWFLVFNKADAKRAALRADTESKRKALVNLRKSTAGIENLGKKIEQLQDAIRFFESKLPQEHEVHNILKEISQMAEANTLQTRTVKTNKSERAANYREQPIQVNISGDFNGFYSFLLQLETLPRITRITQMKLVGISDRDGEMQAEMTLSIFFEPGTSVASAQ
jgi:type IV pilus assembly protein PilO